MELGKPRHGERAHRREVLVEAAAASRVGLADDFVDERLPRWATREIAAPSHQKRLLRGAIERTVYRLAVAALTRLLPFFREISQERREGRGDQMPATAARRDQETTAAEQDYVTRMAWLPDTNGR